MNDRRTAARAAAISFARALARRDVDMIMADAADRLMHLETWIAAQPDPKPSRSEAIKGLLKASLGGEHK